MAKAFAAIGYVPLCLHVNAKVAGVPQNRPRFILLGVRENIFKLLKPTFNVHERSLFGQPEDFFRRTKSGNEIELDSLVYRDISKINDLELFKGSFLKSLIVSENNFVTVFDAIDDLRNGGSKKSSFAKGLETTFSKVLRKHPMRSHELRANNALVQRRFRLYQILQLVDNETRKNVLSVLQGTAHDLSDVGWEKLKSSDYLVESGEYVRFNSKKELLSFLDRHPTKKQTQKALLASQPAPAALSIPDDGCHYHHDELRTLTVREMARIQSFPDNFEFWSKTTTGGKMRSFEVPQYTQVGNAVPPMLGRALGFAVKELLKRLS